MKHWEVKQENSSIQDILVKDKNGEVVEDLASAVEIKFVEQKITVNKWEGTDEVHTPYSPHKLIVSKAGYETLEIDNLMISDPIDWHFELQEPSECIYPDPSIVRIGSVYGEGSLIGEYLGMTGNNFEGNLEEKTNLEGNLEEKTNLEGNLEDDSNLSGELQDL